MKTLITVIGVIAFATVAFLLFFNAEIISYTSDFTQILNFPGHYNCAASYDLQGDYSQGIVHQKFENNAVKSKYYAALNMELYENRCFITVESWAHQTKYESNIWSNDWKTLSYINQLYVGDVEPRNAGEAKLVENYCYSKQLVDGTYQKNAEEAYNLGIPLALNPCP